MLRSARWLAVVALLVLSATQAAYGVCAGPLLAVAVGADPSDVLPVNAALRALVLGGGLAAAAFALSFLALAAAVGVATGHRYGWALGVAASVLWAPSGCLPVALVALAVLLHPDVRQAAWAARAAPPAPPRGERTEPTERHA